MRRIMRAFRSSIALPLLFGVAVLAAACAGADNSNNLLGGDDEGGAGGEAGAAGSVTTQPAGGKAGAAGTAGASGKGGAAGGSGAAGAGGKGGAAGTGGKGGASGGAGAAGAAGKAGAAGTGGAAGKSGAAGAAGTSGSAGAAGAAGKAGAAGTGGSSQSCDPTDEGADYNDARSLGDIDDSSCEQSLEGITESPGDVDWFTYNGTDGLTLGGCDTKPYARFLSGQAASEVCIYAVSSGIGFSSTPICAKGTPTDDGPPGDLLGTVYGCCDANEVQLDYNTPIIADNATIFIRVTGGDDTCRPYKLTHGYGE